MAECSPCAMRLPAASTPGPFAGWCPPARSCASHRARMPTASATPPGSPEQRHALAARAVALTFQGRAVASHASALTVLGLPVLDADLGQIHLTRTGDSLSRHSRHIVMHGSYGAGACCPDEPCVTPVLAVLGNAMLSGTESGVTAMDRALATGVVTAADLRAGLERLASWPGVGQARLAVALADGRAESVGETRTRLLLGAVGFGDVVPQVRITDARGSRRRPSGLSPRPGGGRIRRRGEVRGRRRPSSPRSVERTGCAPWVTRWCGSCGRTWTTLTGCACSCARRWPEHVRRRRG